MPPHLELAPGAEAGHLGLRLIAERVAGAGGHVAFHHNVPSGFCMRGALPSRAPTPSPAPHKGSARRR